MKKCTSFVSFWCYFLLASLLLLSHFVVSLELLIQNLNYNEKNRKTNIVIHYSDTNSRIYSKNICCLWSCKGCWPFCSCPYWISSLDRWSSFLNWFFKRERSVFNWKIISSILNFSDLRWLLLFGNCFLHFFCQLINETLFFTPFYRIFRTLNRVSVFDSYTFFLLPPLLSFYFSKDSDLCKAII